jgi:hypothetical protein
MHKFSATSSLMQALQSSTHKSFTRTNACISLKKWHIYSDSSSTNFADTPHKKELQNLFIWKTSNGEIAKYAPKKWFQSNFILPYSSSFNRSEEAVKS